MSAATSLREKVNIDEILAQQSARKTSTSQRTVSATESKFAAIASNPFYSVVFNPELSPEQKKAELTKLRVYEGTKEENREKAKAYDLFKEYLQEQRELMSREIISLTDTETFAELQSTYRDINDALLKFEEDMAPLTDIIDAVYALRTAEGGSKVLDAFKEIKADANREVEIQQRRDEARSEFEVAQGDVSTINRDIASLRTQKTLFGLGGLKPEAAAAIARREIELEEAIERVSAAENTLTSINTETIANTSKLGDNLVVAKEKLKELLNLSGSEHTDRQKQLVASALNFINTSKDRIGSIREHLGGMDTQIDNLSDTNTHMTQIYAIMTEAEKAASTENVKLREGLAAAPADENLIQKMERETKQRDIDEHIKAVAQSTVDTQATYADLASGAVRILTMKDATSNQIVKAREMHSRGVAGIADRLSTVLQAVSGAAISEAQSMAQDTHRHMVDSTNRIAQKESIRVAMGINDTNADLERLAADLESYGDISKASTGIIRSGLEEMSANLAKIEEIRNSVEQGTKEAIGIAAEVSATGSKPAGSGKVTMPKSGAAPSPFKLGSAA